MKIKVRRPCDPQYPISLEYKAWRNYWRAKWIYNEETQMWIRGNKDGLSQHRGTDFATPIGTPLYACKKGTIALAHYSRDGFGKRVTLRFVKNENLYYAIYAHLSDFSVEPGQRVEEGEEIAKSGATGNVKGAHLHFELRDNKGEPQEPDFYWKKS